MPSPNAIALPLSIGRFQLSTVNFRLFCSNSFRFTHFRENAPANPLVSHTFKTKDLKPFRFIHFQKKVGGAPNFASRISIFGSQLSTVNSRLFYSNSFRVTYIRKNASANPYGSHTCKTKDLKPFRITYFQKKGTGQGDPNFVFRFSSFEPQLSTFNCRLSTSARGKLFPCPSSSSPLI